jgi:hypothetical protein
VGSGAGRSSGGTNSSSSGGPGGGQGGAAAAGGGGSSSKGPVNANYLLNFQYDSRTVRVSCSGRVGEWVCGAASGAWCCERGSWHEKQDMETQPLDGGCTTLVGMPAKTSAPSSYHPSSPPLPIHRLPPHHPSCVQQGGGRGGRPPAAGSSSGGGARRRAPAPRLHRYDKDKFLQANFRFLVSGEGGRGVSGEGGGALRGGGGGGRWV